MMGGSRTKLFFKTDRGRAAGRVSFCAASRNRRSASGRELKKTSSGTQRLRRGHFDSEGGGKETGKSITKKRDEEKKIREK